MPLPALGPRTSCRQVVHIGDSTSEHLWDAETVGGDPSATMEARYHAVGVEDVYNDTSGGRSMVERLNRQQRNALEVATEVRRSGYRGCWVLMIGTNDAANVAAGARTGADERIESMLAVIGSDPVLWVNTASASTITWYGDDSMQAFNAALAAAAARHPNVWVFDWAAAVQPDWYGPDGLHPNATGRAWRTALTAQELAWAFPG
jgi:lysophospholipase L1-like esterase